MGGAAPRFAQRVMRRICCSGKHPCINQRDGSEVGNLPEQFPSSFCRWSTRRLRCGLRGRIRASGGRTVIAHAMAEFREVFFRGQKVRFDP